MVTRPTWQGHLRLSLVSCPVALYSAISPGGDVHFNMLHKTTHNRIRMIPTDPETGPVDRADIVKGYEIDKDRYVVVTQDEIDAVRLESTRTIDIERFVDAEEIDRLYWDAPYYLAPDGKLAAEAFSVIRSAMTHTGSIGLGRVTLHQRERLLAIEPRDKGMLAYSLRTHDEVRAPSEVFGSIPDARADKGMVEIAEKIIDQLHGAFEPEGFTDRYEDALRALIKEKEKGGGRKVAVQEPDDTNVVDLMDMLKRSLRHPEASPKTAARSRTAAPARKAASSKRHRA